MKGHLHKLDKATRDRHFPESNGGKGSRPRTSTAESRKKFADNYDKIFEPKPWPIPLKVTKWKEFVDETKKKKAKKIKDS